MANRPLSRLICCLLVVFAFGCGRSSGPTSSSQADAVKGDGADSDRTTAPSSSSPTLISGGQATECDASQPPFVMAHGFIGAGDTWSRPVRLFVRNGHCADRYHAFDWNSIDRAGDHATALDSFIDEVRQKHGVEQVDLIGHSAGGGVSYTFMETASRAEKIRKYVHIGSFPSPPPETAIEAGVDMLNVWSPDDTVVEGADIDGVENRQMKGQDHYEVATSKESFGEIYTFLYGIEPEHLELEPLASVRVAGRSLSLGEAAVQNGAQVTVWSMDDTGQREDALHTITTDQNGYWGPVDIDGDRQHEFELIPVDDSPRLRYFHEPFVTHDPLVYIRSFPAPGSIANLLVSLVPLEGDGVSLIVFNSTRAFLAGRDSLTLNGKELLTPQTGGPEQTSIALFIFDIDDDGETGSSSGLFDSFPFLTAIDEPMQSKEGESIRLVYNGRELILPKDPADKGGLVAIFR